MCPRCSGSGRVDDAVCPECHGDAQGLWLSGWWIFWGGRVSVMTLAVERGERVVRVVIDALALLAGIAGLVLLGWHVWQERHAGFRVSIFFADPLLVWFWISGLVDLYLIYRLAQESHVASRVVPAGQAVMPMPSTMAWNDRPQLHRRAFRDAFQAYRLATRRIVQSAWRIGRLCGEREVTAFHVLAALVSSGHIDLVFARLGVNSHDLIAQIKHSLRKGATAKECNFSSACVRIFLCAYAEASQAKHPFVEPIDLLIALVASQDPLIDDLFREQGVTVTNVRHVSEWLSFHKDFVARASSSRARAQFKPKGEMNRSYTSIVTPFLDRFSHDLTSYARGGAFEPLVNREHEMTTLFQLINAGHRGIVLVGEQGTGRTIFIEGLAQRMATEEVPRRLVDQRLVSISVGALVAGASGLGSFEQRLLGVLGEAQRSGNIILCFENIHELVGIESGGSASLDLAQVLVDAFERSQLIILATTTPSAWAHVIERTDLSHKFQSLSFGELNHDTVMRILESKAPFIESRSRALFSYPSLEALIGFSDKYIHEQRLPEKAINLMEEVAQKVRAERGAWSVVTESDIASFISQKTSIPISAVTGDESEKLLELENLMHRRVVGQDEAVRAVATAVRRARTQLREEKRPIVNLLFLGPTGVGKTEVARTLAEVYFGSEEIMVRFDMSEFQHPGSIERLIGVTGGPPGQLTEIVRRRPFVLILLDEIEKAHRDILNIFLQVMDDGRLTDASNGLTIDFTNTIIIATSNAGSVYIQDAVRSGDSADKIRADLMNRELREYFSPEWLNRFDNIIVFKPLSLEDVGVIARLMMDRIIKKLAAQEIDLQIDEAVFAELAQAGFSPEFGARPLRRAIQDKVEDSLAKIMLMHRITRRDTLELHSGFEWSVKKAKKL